MREHKAGFTVGENKPHKNAHKATVSSPTQKSQAHVRRWRTRRLNAEKKPFDLLDVEIKTIHQRVEEGELDRNDARVMLQAYALRKDLLLGKLRVTEVMRKLEESDVREEWEEVKRELGITA